MPSKLGNPWMVRLDPTPTPMASTLRRESGPDASMFALLQATSVQISHKTSFFESGCLPVLGSPFLQSHSWKAIKVVASLSSTLAAYIPHTHTSYLDTTKNAHMHTGKIRSGPHILPHMWWVPIHDLLRGVAHCLCWLQNCLRFQPLPVLAKCL